MVDDSTGKVCFSYKRNLHFGDSVRLVGNCLSLGLWNPAQGIPLTTNGSCYPVWTTPMPVKLPFGETIEYQYVVIRAGKSLWESIPNRAVCVTNRMILVEDTEKSTVSKQFIKNCPPAAKPQPATPQQTPVSKPFSEAEDFRLSDEVIVATMTLPITVRLNPEYTPGSATEEKWRFEPANGLWLPIMHEIAIREDMKIKWVGCLDCDLTDEADQEAVATVLKKRYSCYPLFLPHKLRSDHKKYCTGIIFPVFHNVIDIDPENIPQYSLDTWDSYRMVNSKFADKIMEIYTGEEMVWVNDYHLLLVSSFVSRRTREPVNIGLYLHVPFPSSEMFRVIPHRDALLHAMLCNDLIGFHLFEYARHFLTCCKRILGVGHKCRRGGFIGLEFYGRYIMLRVGHLGIEPQVLRIKTKSDLSRTTTERILSEHSGKRLLIGIDPLHRLSGITLKMNAFRELMSELNDSEQRETVLLQVMTKSEHSDPVEADAVRREILDLNAVITKEFGKEIIHVVEIDLNIEERLGYLKAADAIIITTVRDGLNLIPFEYIAVREAEPKQVILSEFAGVSLALCSPVRVNPFDLNALKEAIYNAVTTTSQSPPMLEKDRNFVLTHTTFRWVENFLSDLKKAKKQEKRFQYVVHGFGDKLKLVALRKRLTYLIGDDLLEDYRNAHCRAFFFDSEGTLSSVLTTPDPLQTSKYEKNLHILDELSKDERNSIFVISGRERKLLEMYYHSVSRVGIAAEHGAFIKMSHQSHWELIPTIHNRWKDAAIDIINGYVMRTEGSYCEIKETSVVFQYRNADPDYGDWQAKELTTQLDIIMRPYLDECEVCSGNGYVEVKPRGINKGTALRLLCKRVAEKFGEIDFVMAVGDDVNDEEMFSEIKDLKSERSDYFNHDTLKIVTCTIGKKPSRAKFYINDSTDLTHILDLLRTSSMKVTPTQHAKHYSHSDFRTLVQLSAQQGLPRLEKRMSTKAPLTHFDLIEEEERQLLT